MKALHITCLVLSFLLVPFGFFWNYTVLRKVLFNIDAADQFIMLSFIGTLIYEIFFLLVITTTILSLIRIKTTTMMVIGIINLVIAGIGTLLSTNGLINDRSTFIAFWPFYSFLALVVLGLAIPGLVQAVRKR